MTIVRTEGVTYVSASTIRVRLAFSIVNLVLPSWPAMRPEEKMLASSDVEPNLAHVTITETELTNRARQMIPLQRLDVLDLERVEVKVVQSQQCNCVLRVGMRIGPQKTEGTCLHSHQSQGRMT